MSWLASILLHCIHVLYSLVNAVSSFRQRFNRKPQSLNAERRQIPTHLAVLLTSADNAAPKNQEDKTLENVRDMVEWCREAGIPRLTIYDRQGEQICKCLSDLNRIYSIQHVGHLSRSSFELRAQLAGISPLEEPESDFELEYPLTPPSSDESLSPKDHPPNLHVVTISSTTQQQRKRRNNSRNVVKRRVQRKSILNTGFCNLIAAACQIKRRKRSHHQLLYT